MTQIVVDASIALSWCFPDEETEASIAVLERLSAGEQALVPSFWPLEILNTLLVGERRGRITAADCQTFLGKLRLLRPEIDNVTLDHVSGQIQTICRDHRLTPYDAIYIDLALRRDCLLATLDRPQKEAATSLGVVCL